MNYAQKAYWVGLPVALVIILIVIAILPSPYNWLAVLLSPVFGNFCADMSVKIGEYLDNRAVENAG